MDFYVDLPKAGTIENYSTDKRFKAFIMIEVLEHLLNAKAALSTMNKLAQPPALLFGTTPNIESEYWDKMRNIYDPNDHIFLFSMKSIQILLSDLGYKSLTYEYFGGDSENAHILFSGVL